MPNYKIHCEISRKRTGKTFEEIHKWMDEATEYLGADHRLERHFYTEEYKNYIEKRWGKPAVVEWLFHIALDNLETANKFAVDVYNKNYGKIDFIFDGKEICYCEFIKVFPNSLKSYSVILKDKCKEKVDSIKKRIKYYHK